MDDPHQNQPLERSGASLEDATVAMVLVHGRGARARGMLDLAREVRHDDVAYLAPQAQDGSWYPQLFLAPLEANEPNLSSALRAVGDAIETAVDGGVPRERVVLLGFSQGACLATEFAARNARRYGGVVALSGGLIGPAVDRERYEGSMAGTPVFLGCGDRDPHIPVERVHESAAVFDDLEAAVTDRIYRNVGHTVLSDELTVVRQLLEDVVESTA
ncbi:alpha/beta hydrolase [Natronobeatus ordinarius]|uniref:alpha/beta hydrolase n=1 Tax=Natronobeatus ordinarius TaxID=2963433 RepID=UPI0020CC5719|nr:dienelactone hydrolase family protein [Natronobeatus ordinarius]